MTPRLRRPWKGAGLAVVLVLLITGVAAAASVTSLLGYQFEFLSFTDNGDNTSTWTYAVTANGDEPKGLSHWTLGIDACYDLIAPADGSQYTTPTTGFGCGETYNCLPASCKVVYGTDPTTGVNGVKFEDCSPQLSGEQPGTHIFAFTVNGVPDQGGAIEVGAKAGTSSPVGSITGPACTPTAVTLRDFRAGVPVAASLPVAGALAAAGLALLALLFRRHNG